MRTYIVLYDFEYLADGKVLGRLESSVLPCPSKRRTFFAVGLELQQRVINAVE